MKLKPLNPDLEEILNDPEAYALRFLQWKSSFLIWFFDCFRTKDEGDGQIKEAPKYKYLYWIHYLLTRKPGDEDYSQVIWIEKSRQQFVTWFMVAYCLWLLMFDKNKRIVYASKTESQVTDVIKNRFQVAYNNIDPLLPKPNLEFTALYIKRQSQVSTEAEMLLRGLSASGKGSRGDTGYLVWLDEVAEQDEQKALIEASLDSANSPEAKFIGVTTGSSEPKAEYSRLLIANSIDPSRPIKELSEGVRLKWNTRGHAVLQIDYDANPAKRNPQWRIDTERKLGSVAFMINHGHLWEVPVGSKCYWAANKERHAKPTQYNPLLRTLIGFDPGSTNGVGAVCFLQIGRTLEMKPIVNVLDAYSIFGAGVDGLSDHVYDWLVKHNCSNFKIITDPAGSYSNAQGLSGNTISVLAAKFGASKVAYCKISKPLDRISFTNDLLFKAPYEAIKIPDDCGEFIYPDGSENPSETHFFWKCINYYCVNKNGNPIKDNKHDHMPDAFSYAVYAALKPKQIVEAKQFEKTKIDRFNTALAMQKNENRKFFNY
jgi:hypothetical protein